MNKKIIHTVFEQAATQYPEHIAIRDTQAQISYDALNKEANRLAHLLQSIGLQKGSIVAVLATPAIALVRSVLAIFKSAGIYLPADINQAESRLDQAFSEASPSIAITDLANFEKVKSLLATRPTSVQHLIVHTDAGCSTVYNVDHGTLTATNLNLSNFSDANPTLQSEDSDGNYIFYTSGSTGKAKAILGCHKGLGHFINWETEEFKVNESFRVSMLSQFTFDASLRDIFLPLTNGGTLCIPSQAIRTNTVRLLEWIADNQITLVHCVPSIFKLMTRELQEFPRRNEIRQHLKFILMAGEPLYAKDITAWRSYMGETTELVNLYGTSETTLAKTFHRIREVPADPSQVLHVGRPMNNTIVALFNGNQPCNPGEVGEIYIKTPFRTKGYYNNEALTRQVFVQNPLVTDKEDILHRTGDFGKYNADGTIEVLGRRDDQVKVNGIRVELGEVRHAVAGIPGIDEVEVLAHVNEQMENELACYYTGTEYEVETLTKLLASKLNPGTVPTYFFHLTQFKLNINGKIDKRALPTPDEILISQGTYEEPVGTLETELEQIWAQVLGLKRVGRKASFFRIGGNSLKAMQVVSRIYKVYNQLLNITELFAHQTIEKLALFIEQGGQKQLFDEIVPTATKDLYDLSMVQMGVYIACNTAQDNVAFNIPLSYVLEGDLDIDAFRRAFDSVVARHESLRTTFVISQGAPKQKIHQAGNFPFTIGYTDLSGDASKLETATALANAQAVTVFDFENGPLVKAHLVRMDEASHIFLLTIHHIVADGWSMEVLVQELTNNYNNYRNGRENKLPALGIQYKDFAAWQQLKVNERAIESGRNYWLQRLSGELPELELPVDFAKTEEENFEGFAKNYLLNAGFSSAIKELCRRNDTTLFMFLLSAVNVLLYRYSGQKDILLGSPASGRVHRDLEDQIGLYVNMLVHRTRFGSDTTFTELLDEVKTNALDAFQHQSYPFMQLVKDLGAQKNIFSAAVQLQNAKLEENKGLQFEGLKISNFLPNAYTSKFDITFNFEDLGEVVSLDIEYKTRLFNTATIDRMAHDLMFLVEAVTADPSRTVRELKDLLVQKAEPKQMAELSALIAKGLDADY